MKILSRQARYTDEHNCWAHAFVHDSCASSVVPLTSDWRNGIQFRGRNLFLAAKSRDKCYGEISLLLCVVFWRMRSESRGCTPVYSVLLTSAHHVTLEASVISNFLNTRHNQPSYSIIFWSSFWSVALFSGIKHNNLAN